MAFVRIWSILILISFFPSKILSADDTNISVDNSDTINASIREKISSEFLPLASYMTNASDRFSKHFQYATNNSIFLKYFRTEYLDFILDHSPSSYEKSDSLVNSKDIKLVKRVKKEDGYWTAALDVPKINSSIVRSAFRRGYTVVVNRMNHRHKPLFDLAQEVAATFGYRTNINLYITPPSSQGFDLHFDVMHSIVLQVEGEKFWSISKPLYMLPFYNHHFKPPNHLILENDMKNVRLNTTLKAGDVLYLPPGVLHEALTSLPSKSFSVHVTIGIEVDPLYTYAGFLHLLLFNLQNNSNWNRSISDFCIIDHESIEVVSSNFGNFQATKLSFPTLYDILQLCVFEVCSREYNHGLRAPLSWLPWNSNNVTTLFSSLKNRSFEVLDMLKNVISQFNASNLFKKTFKCMIKSLIENADKSCSDDLFLLQPRLDKLFLTLFNFKRLDSILEDSFHCTNLTTILHETLDATDSFIRLSYLDTLKTWLENAFNSFDHFRRHDVSAFKDNVRKYKHT